MDSPIRAQQAGDWSAYWQRIRERLLVALLAGCGLRISEACRVRWADLDATGATLRIEDPSGLRSRTVPVPQG